MARMRKYGESKTTRIMMATVPHFTSGLGLRKFQADGFLLTRVYLSQKLMLYEGCFRPKFSVRFTLQSTKSSSVGPLKQNQA